MGRGIAQIAAQAGLPVRLFDARPGAAEEARAAIGAALARLAARGKLPAAEVDAAVARLAVLDDLTGLAGCGVVVEAIVEELEAKRSLFRSLEPIVGEGCTLATNTSSLSVTAMAAGLARPERVAGFHFFNPVPLMKVVEVVSGLLTAPAVAEGLVALAERMGHTPVRAKDTPGFLVNHAGRGLGTEGLRLLAEGVAGVEDIDRVLRDTAGFKLGPFELMDLTALDVSHPVMESVYRQYYEEPRFRPQPLTRQMLAAGLLGRKSGHGFYPYGPEGAIRSPEPPPAAERPAGVWVSHARPALRQRVVALLARLGARLDEGVAPDGASLCLVTPVGEDVTALVVREGLDAARTVATDALFPLDQRRVLMASPGTHPAMREAARGLLGADGKPVTVIRDSPGLVAQRVVATIVNIACEIAQQRIATPGDIDRAVVLGLGYPRGPLAWGDALGPATVLEILQNLLALTGDPRYRPSPWLRRRAALDLSLLAVD
ncbi:MAG: 3-hydroxyacyl-CoA dehydrogenase [Deltaproteobacteria bacterium]|nr:3-hydroxyacyl-CoA dehydrogenase [Deltaproteobacteria bacterium]